MKGSSKALLWVILVFATGSIFGSVVSFLVVKNRVDQAVERIREGGPGPSRESRFLKRMLSRLDLDQDQEKQVREILERSRLRAREVEKDRKRDLHRVRRETMQEIRAVLRPDQQEELELFLRSLQRRSRREHDRSDSPRP